MLTPQGLHELASELAGTKVLTVYHDARVTDPAMRHAWRPALAAALRAARDGLGDADERAEFDRASAHLDAPMPALDGVWGAPGWVAFLTADGLRYGAQLPVHPSTLAAWREGPVISPYLRALKQQRAVIIALVDSRSARLYRYARGVLEELPELAVVVGEEPAVPAPATRRVVDPDHAQRRRLATFQRLALALAQRLAEAAGDDGWVLIGGTTRWAQLAGAALPAPLAARAMVSRTLDHDASRDAIAAAARRAATALRAAYGMGLVDWLLERAGAGGKAAVGVPAVQRALLVRAVDLLVVSPAVVRAGRYDGVGEDAVRAAVAQGADVEVLSGEAAARLDRLANGIAARLRFAIDEPVAARAAGTGNGTVPFPSRPTEGGDDAA